MVNAQPADESLFEYPPFKLQATFNIPQPAAKVWEDLTADDALHWCKVLSGFEWTSPRPFAVGSTRVVKSLKSTNVFDETFFHWDEGHRKSFYVAKCSWPPMFDRFAEDYVVEPTGEDSCKFTWTIAVEFKTWAKPGIPINRAILKTLFRDTRDFYGLS
jgi:hypothetical protein